MRTELSGLMAIREFGRRPDPFFKTSNDIGAQDLRISTHADASGYGAV
jgi:hypothetical protein